MRLFGEKVFLGQMERSGGVLWEEGQEWISFDCLLGWRTWFPTVYATVKKMKGDIDHGSKLYWPKTST
ncbi:MAG: hypothetical protein CML56_03390 [Rhodobacteraceae bacterium]|nr:hypothetical protein [Paracoccaceae bacterium]